MEPVSIDGILEAFAEYASFQDEKIARLLAMLENGEMVDVFEFVDAQAIGEFVEEVA